jgi:hypothetical protein
MKHETHSDEIKKKVLLLLLLSLLCRIKRDFSYCQTMYYTHSERNK